jgi:iron complex outermembrane receptor protein
MRIHGFCAAFGIAALLSSEAGAASEVPVAGAGAQDDESLLELSLDDLLELTVTGAAVRDLGLNESVQTGNPFGWRLSQMAASVEVIDRDTMQARGLGNVIEAAENLVGVLSGDSPAEPHSFSMRGFSRNSISVLHDGISVGIAILNTRPQGTFNLDRLEISKGIATLNHGQGAAGGSVNLISRKPRLGTASVVDSRAEYGSFQSRSLGLGLDGPLVHEGAYFVGLDWVGSNGFVDRSESSSLNLSSAFRWRLQGDALLTLSFNYLDDELPAYWGTPLVPGAIARAPLSGVVRLPDDRVIDSAMRRNNYNVADRLIGSESLMSRFDVERPWSDAGLWQFSLYRFEADRDWRNAENYGFNPSTGRIDRDRLHVSHRRELHGLRAGIVHKHLLLGRDHRVAGHVEYSDNRFRRTLGFDADNPEPFVDSVDPFDPSPGTFGAVDLRPDSLRARIAALVVEDAWQWTRNVRVDLSVRHEQIAIDRQRRAFDGSPVVRATLDRTFRQQSHRLGLHYGISDAVQVYGQLGRQHDPVESDITGVFFADRFRPSEIRQMELGMKSTFDRGRIESTLAWFRADKQQDIVTSDGTSRANEQWSQGVEAAMRMQLSENVRIGGNLAYTDSRFDHYYDLDFDRIADGSRPINVPTWHGNVWGSVNRIAGLPVEIGGGVTYVSDRFADSANTTVLEAYSLVSGFVAYSKDRLRVALNVRNALDRAYAPWADATYPNQVSLGLPRHYELSVQLKF